MGNFYYMLLTYLSLNYLVSGPMIMTIDNGQLWSILNLKDTVELNIEYIDGILDNGQFLLYLAHSPFFELFSF